MRYVEIPADRALGVVGKRFASRPETLEGIAKGSHPTHALDRLGIGVKVGVFRLEDIGRCRHVYPLAFRASCSAFIAAKS